MGSKNISIRDEVYKILLARKRKEESFSDIILREFSNKGDLMGFAGAWKDSLDEKEAKRMKEDILKLRERSTENLVEK